jgi:hypothetical protein
MKSLLPIPRWQDDVIHAAVVSVILDIPQPGVNFRATAPGPKFGRRGTLFSKNVHTREDRGSRRMESFRSLQCHVNLDTSAFGPR